MSSPHRSGRHIKGASFIELVKLLKVYRRRHPLDELREATVAFMGQRILPSAWYPYEIFIELLETAYRRLLDSSEENALQMGIAGGQVALSTLHKAYIAAGDCAGSVLAMRHMWRAQCDFGDLRAELEDGGRAVRFTLTDYPDMPAVHGMTTVGWGVAAARLGGARDAACEVFEKPWEGAPRLSYAIRF